VGHGNDQFAAYIAHWSQRYAAPDFGVRAVLTAAAAPMSSKFLGMSDVSACPFRYDIQTACFTIDDHRAFGNGTACFLNPQYCNR